MMALAQILFECFDHMVYQVIPSLFVQMYNC